MAKLYFKYGAMGSSKTATALITKYNYEERGMRVWLIKPAADRRDGEFTLAIAHWTDGAVRGNRTGVRFAGALCRAR